MPLADAIAGALRPGQEITWSRANGAAEDLSGATLTGTLIDKHANTTRAIAGALAVSDGPNGVFTWTYDAADVVAAVYDVRFTAAFGGGATPAKTFLTQWVVHA